MCRVLFVLAAVCSLACGSHIHMHSSRLDGRIFGRRDADISELPYQLSLHIYGSYICGASIISADWAVTAAHCVVFSSSASHIILRAGSSTRNSGGSVHQAERIVINPNYDSTIIDYDYALIKVVTPFPVGGDNVQPIVLADTEPEDGDIANTSGWGMLSSGSYPEQLQRVDLPIIARNTCQDRYGEFNITDRMICAGGVGLDFCQGNNGGPLVFNGRLVGIVSWGIGCGLLNYPGVYTNVANQLDWIREQTGLKINQ